MDIKYPSNPVNTGLGGFRSIDYTKRKTADIMSEKYWNHWNSRRWFQAMGKIELIDTGRLTEKQARLNMEKCAEFLARMIQKYGDVVLGEIEERNAQLQGK